MTYIASVLLLGVFLIYGVWHEPALIASLLVAAALWWLWALVELVSRKEVNKGMFAARTGRIIGGFLVLVPLWVACVYLLAADAERPRALLFLLALALTHARVVGLRPSAAEAGDLESCVVSGVVPLAVPLLAGPGAISTTIIAAQARSLTHLAAMIACIAVVCVLLWLVMRFAHALAPRLGTTGLNIATRLLGLLLTAIAIQTMAEGLLDLLPGLR